MKENLILVNAFYTNSILLKGLIGYLDKHFNLYFIDLPGFAKHSPPLEKISINLYARYVFRRIEELHLDHYIVAGISFGFLVVNNIDLDGKCKGIVAIFPYINKNSLKLNKGKRVFYNFASQFLISINQAGSIWKNKVFHTMAYLYSSYPKDRVEVILEHMDGKTFFETARIILNNEDSLKFQKFPYALVLNKSDNTIKYDYSLKIFKQNVKDLMVVHSEADHYPDDIEESYFLRAFPKKDINRIVRFFNSRYRA